MTTDTLSENAIQHPMNRAQAERIDKQYSFTKIFSIWALASLPGSMLYWLGLPFMDKYTEINTGYSVLIVLAVPYVWHFILAFLILKKESGELRWKTIKDRLWLKAPTDPRTGKPNNALWLWVIPAIAAYGLTAASPIFLSINDGWARILPIHEPA